MALPAERAVRAGMLAHSGERAFIDAVRYSTDSRPLHQTKSERENMLLPHERECGIDVVT